MLYTVEIHQVGGHGHDSNIYLIVDERIALVDTGTGTNFELVEQNLGKFKVKPSDINLIIDTHCHYDHAGGNRDFASASGCPVAIHESEAEALRGANPEITIAGAFDAHLDPIESIRELRGGEQLELGEMVLEVLHTPGHTHGSICLYDRERRALFSGDTVFYDGIGRMDFPTGDSAAMGRSLQKLNNLDARGLFPGHGPATDTRARECIEAALKLLGPGI